MVIDSKTFRNFLIYCLGLGAVVHADAQSVFPPRLEREPTIEIGELILSLLPAEREGSVRWDHGSSGPVVWLTPGYATRKNGRGQTIYIREGIVRTNIRGSTAKVLKQRKLELGWTVEYSTRDNPRFGVHQISIIPGLPDETCFGTTYEGCDFDPPLASLASVAIGVKQLCERSFANESIAVYRLSYPGRQTSKLTWTRSGGSGGSSADLSIEVASSSSTRDCVLSTDRTPESDQLESENRRALIVKERIDSPPILELPSREQEIFKLLVYRTQICMRSGSVAFIRGGQTDVNEVSRLVAGMCGGNLDNYLTAVIRRPVEEARSFILALATEQVRRFVASK